MSTHVHIAKVSWLDDDAEPHHENFASLDGEIYYSFGHSDPEWITADDVLDRAEGDGNFKPMGYHRNFFRQVLNLSSPTHVEYEVS